MLFIHGKKTTCQNIRFIRNHITKITRSWLMRSTFTDIICNPMNIVACSKFWGDADDKLRKTMQKVAHWANEFQKYILRSRQMLNKKLSYRRETEWRAMLVNLCYISRAIRLMKVSRSKSDLQGHWQWCHSISHTWFPISLPLQLCLYLAPFTRYMLGVTQGHWK